jgi:hypothetical protein
MCAELSMQKEGKRVASGPHGHPGNETRWNPHGGRWVSMSRAHVDPLHRASSSLWRRSKFTCHVRTWFCIRPDISRHSSSTRWDGPRLASHMYIHASSACIQEISPLRRVRLLDFTCRVRVRTWFLGLQQAGKFSTTASSYVNESDAYKNMILFLVCM